MATAGEGEGGRWSGRSGQLGVAGLLFAGTLLLYAQVARHGFLLYDDWTYVGDPHVRTGLSLRNLGWALTTLTFSNWHPLTWLSYMLDVELFGLDAGAMHLVNAVWHGGNAGLLFLVLVRLTGAPGRSAVVAALFAVHPLHVESVAWIAERKDLLSTAFGLVALGAYARYAERPGVGRYAVVAAAFAASLMAKPMLVTLPFVLLLLDFWPLRRISARAVLEKLPLLGLALASSIVTLVAQDRGGALQGLELSVGARVSNAGVAYLGYLGKTFWPASLSIFYPYRDVPAGKAAAAIVLVLAATAAALLQARRRPWLAVGWCWFVGTLVPVIGLVQVGGQALADRYTYFPSIGLFVAIAWGAHAVLSRGAPRWVPAATTGGVVAALALVSWRQLALWRDHETLFRHAIAVTGDARAHMILAAGLRSAGRLDQALVEAREAVRLRPTSARGWATLGMVEADLGHPAAAFDALEAAVRLDPRLALGWTFLGQAAAQLGRLDDAERALLRATALAPDDARAWNELGLVLASRGRWEEAIDAYRRAAEADPSVAPPWLNLASACARLGRTVEARAALEAAVRAEPANPAGWRELGRFLRGQGMFAEAAQALREAERLEGASRAGRGARDGPLR